jgi:hypothetical protein
MKSRNLTRAIIAFCLALNIVLFIIVCRQAKQIKELEHECDLGITETNIAWQYIYKLEYFFPNLSKGFDNYRLNRLAKEKKTMEAKRK